MLRTRSEMLKYLGSQVSGAGVEFGAGHFPFPVPEAARVTYADRNTVCELTDRRYFGNRALVQTDLQSDFEEMNGIEDDSLDFIIASHVIEHTRNPLRALQCAFQRLKRDGKLVLVVPDKSVTFDRNRGLTSLSHLILDFEHPSPERDLEHYIEFFRLAFPQPDPEASARWAYERNHDIHFHTWTYETFMETVAYACHSISTWSSVWSHRRMSCDDIEFYYLLTK